MSAPQALLGFTTTWLLCWVLVLTQRWHGRYTHDRFSGVQKFHQNPTPRVGGLAIMVALGFMAMGPLSGGLPMEQGAPVGALVLPASLLLAAIPAFLAGLADDLSLTESAGWRLLATLLSGALAWWWGGVQLQRIGLPLVDAALALPLLSLLFTAFALAGLANAINIIDGFNGQSGGVVLIILLALSAMAAQVADAPLMFACLALASVVGGFLAVNFPLGRIFLGDGGAYLLGFLTGCLAILLAQRNEQVSPLAVLLVLAYPVFEVGISLWRRRHRGQALLKPDRLHLHMLLERRYTRLRWPQAAKVWHNAGVAPVIWAVTAVGAGAAVWAWPSTARAALGLAVFVLVYLALYRRLVRQRWG